MFDDRQFSVSVIIPLYNKASQISRSLNSVLMQSFRDFEIIVVDDGSTDNGPNIVNNIKDHRITLIHQSNAGPGAARNTGIKLAKSPFVSFLDADDEWHPDFLKSTMAEIQKNHVAMVSTSILELPRGYDYLENLEKCGLKPGIFSFKGNENPEHVERLLSVITAKSSLIVTEVARKYGGFYDKKRCIYGEDRTFLWRIAFNERFMIIGQKLAYYYTEDSELGKHDQVRPFPPFLENPQTLLDYCPPHLHKLIHEVLDILALRQIQNQYRYTSRLKLFGLLLRHPGAKRYPGLYYSNLKRLMPGFLTWQRLKNRFKSKIKHSG